MDRFAPTTGRSRRVCAAWAAAVACLAAPCVAAAARIELGPFSAVQPVGSETSLLVPRFDPALGSLTGVSLDFALSWDGGLAYYDNESPRPVGGTFHQYAAFHITIGDLSDVAIVSSQIDATLPADDDTAPDFLGADSLEIAGEGTLDHLVETSAVDAFVGTGSFELGMGVSGATATPPLLPDEWVEILDVESGSVAWEVRVVYEYVPEPDTGLLLALGLVFLRGPRRSAASAPPRCRASGSVCSRAS